MADCAGERDMRGEGMECWPFHGTGADSDSERIRSQSVVAKKRLRQGWFFLKYIITCIWY